MSCGAGVGGNGGVRPNGYETSYTCSVVGLDSYSSACGTGMVRLSSCSAIRRSQLIDFPKAPECLRITKEKLCVTAHH